MFRASRGWWADGKARRLIGLFAFEFAVVVLGVLTAQAVANWSHERSARRDMLANKARADAQIAGRAATSIAYGRVIPCMEQRMIMVMRAASGEAQVDPKMLIRPVVRNLPYTELTGESLLQLREHFGGDVADRYERIAAHVERSQELIYSLANDWQALSIVDPDAGKVGAGDGQEARIVAGRMRSTLRSLGHMSANIGNRARELGIAPMLKPGLLLPRTAAQTCGDGMPSSTISRMDRPCVTGRRRVPNRAR